MLYTREITREITSYLDDREALLILGSRQVGKTTLLKLLMEHIAPPSRAFYLDLEDPAKLTIVEGGPGNLLDYLTSQGAPSTGKSHVFLDEIHYMQNPSQFIKLLVDHYSERVKIICTGSSALDIKLKLHDSMVGRKLVFHLHPLNYREFLTFRNKESLARQLPDEPFSQVTDSTRFSLDEHKRLFTEFLVYGGFPRIALEDVYEKKEKLLGEIVSSYIYRDIRSLFSIIDVARFNHLVKALASQIGALINHSELARLIGIARPTVLNYISILESSFVLSTVPPFSRSERVEIRKAHKIYFADNGIRNYIIGDLSSSPVRTDWGALLENAVYMGLAKRRKELHHIYFWRTKDKTEVDFIYSSEKGIIPIEVKNSTRPHRGMLHFMKKYDIKNGYIAHLGELQKDIITSIPAFWLA
jgi:uncharacterized protein